MPRWWLAPPAFVGKIRNRPAAGPVEGQRGMSNSKTGRATSFQQDLRYLVARLSLLGFHRFFV